MQVLVNYFCCFVKLSFTFNGLNLCRNFLSGYINVLNVDATSLKNFAETFWITVYKFKKCSRSSDECDTDDYQAK